MRVVIVTGIFPPDIGGPATHAGDLQDELAGRGHTAIVVSLTDSPHVDERADLVRYPRRWPWPLRLVAVTWWLVRHRRTYDVVYATGLHPAATAGARLARRPVVAKVVGDPAWERARRLGLLTTAFDEFQDQTPAARAPR
jgi:glycosyltransferase involved in cell wall biosynthesis